MSSRILTVTAICTLFSSHAAWAQRQVKCDGITVTQEPSGYRVTRPDLPAPASVIFETPDHEEVVLSIVQHEPMIDIMMKAMGKPENEIPTEVIILTVDFAVPKVLRYRALENAPNLPAASLAPVVDKNCRRVD